MDHATRPYFCPACEDTYPGRAAYLSHPCVARVLPYLPRVTTAEEPDKELARALGDFASVLTSWTARTAGALAEGVAGVTRALAPATLRFRAAIVAAHDAIEAEHPGLFAELERKQRARERALRRSRRNSAAPARRAARR
jgi:hypothetical protein